MIRAILLLLLSTHFLLAQTAKISGNIVNANQQPLDGAVISLLKSKDSSFVKAAITEPNGNFEFLNVKAGTYLVSSSHLIYQKYVGTPFELSQSDLVLPTIQLKEGEKTLAEVKVTGKKPFVETKIDRTVINVDALISNAGTNAMDVLEK